MRNNWVKSLSLWIDGKRAATGMCIWPWPTTLTGTLEHDGVTHAVVAWSFPRLVLSSKNSVEVDGQSLPLTKTR